MVVCTNMSHFFFLMMKYVLCVQIFIWDVLWPVVRALIFNAIGLSLVWGMIFWQN